MENPPGWLIHLSASERAGGGLGASGQGSGTTGAPAGPLADKTARGNLTLSPWIKAVCLFLGPSVHTCRVIRPNYEREVRFPFMLLNKSRPRSPAISQHRQGAGDLQIKRSHLPVTHTHPWTPPPCFTCAGLREGGIGSATRYHMRLQSWWRGGVGNPVQIPLLML